MMSAKQPTRREQFFLHSTWSNRGETLDELANRCLRMMQALTKLHPAMRCWGVASLPRKFKEYPITHEFFVELFEKGRQRRDDNKEPFAWGGHFVGLHNNLREDYAISIRVAAGIYSSKIRLANSVHIDFPWNVPFDAPLAVPLAPDVIVAVLRAVVDVWSLDDGRVVDTKLFIALRDGKPHDCYLRTGWACYVPASRLASITLPSGVSVTEVPGRGAIWSAANDLYTVTDQEKLSRVFAMEHALTGAKVPTAERIEAG